MIQTAKIIGKDLTTIGLYSDINTPKRDFSTNNSALITKRAVYQHRLS